jgi:SAM-dependent methyltransferase
MTERTVPEREAIDIGYWETSPRESPQADFLHALLNKTGEACILMEKLKAFRSLFAQATAVLELGGGQGWASCLVKRLFPQVRITASDIAPAAVASIHNWERVYEAHVDATAVCKSYDTGFPGASFDLIFAFASAHHFSRHKATFRELHRLLKPGGSVLYLHEPVCRPYIYPLAHWRAATRRPDETTEDVLRYPDILKLARAAGFEAQIVFSPTLTGRFPAALPYFLVLRELPFLQHLLPSSGDFVFRKPA